MANGFGSLYVGSSGLRSAQNALNVVANNLANVDTTGYVRQQVIFEDQNYQQFDVAAVAKQKAGLGVGIGDVVHARDQFIDRTFRTAEGRQAFYNTCYEATQEVETLVRELSGAGYSDTINDMYEVMAEFAKDPSDTANQSVLIQTASLFLEQTQAIYDSIRDYQFNLNTQIRDNIEKINKYGEDIRKLNIQIQRIESAGVETAMDLRDARDQLLDELASFASIEYQELQNGMVSVKLEGTYLVTDSKAYQIDAYVPDATNGFLVPYWPELSEPEEDQYYEVFRVKGIDASKKNDVGELKAILLSRGDHYGNYTDLLALDQYNKLSDISVEEYEDFISGSVALNTQSQLDRFINHVVVAINELLAPTTSFSDTEDFAGGPIIGVGPDGEDVEITADTKVLDVKNCYIGSEGTIPPHELFVRTGCERYSPVVVDDGAGGKKTIFVYNEEKNARENDDFDTARCYTIRSISINSDLVKDPTRIAYMHQNGNIAYDMSERFTSIWDDMDYHLSPSDVTPCDFTGFYTKIVGDLSNKGYVFKTNNETLATAVESIENTRQGVIGVSSDEELVNMIRFQNAYNASSRYMSVVSQMIEHLVTSLGS